MPALPRIAPLVLLCSLGAQQFTPGGREAMPRLPSGSAWTHLVDLDGDGARDLHLRTDAYYHNDGRGRFTLRQLTGFVPTGGPTHVVGDFDGDGDDDVFTPGAVLENRGAPGPAWASSPLTVAPLATGDFNGDQRTDIVVANGVALATSLTTFQTITGTSDLGAVVAVADLDGDGDQDIVRASSPYTITMPWPLPAITVPGNRYVWRNDGGGAFTTVAAFGTNPPATLDVVAFDADGDGDADCGFSQASGWEFWRNLGGGAFAPWAGLSFQPYVEPCDFDGDGDTDLVGTAGWHENLGLGAFAWRQLPLMDSELHAIGDVDGDGDRDLVFGDISRERRLLLNQGAQDFVEASAFAWRASGTGPALVAGDVDGDGFPDLLESSAIAGPLTHRNQGDGWFAASPGVATSLLADLDDDGDLDALGNTWQAALNDGAGTFTPTALTFVPPYSLNILQARDVDGDGDIDLIGHNTFTASLIVMRNTGNLVFAAATPVPVTGTSIGASAAADFDGDGDVDLLLGSSSAVRMFRNDGSGSFTFDLAGVVGASGNSISDLAVGDLDGDGDEDVLVGRYLGTNPSHIVLRNAGGVLTEAQNAVPAHSAAAAAMLGDVDADGDLDAVVGTGTSGATSQLHLWRNDGTGTFTFAENLQLPTTDPVRLVDVDLDGDADLIADRRLHLNRHRHFEAPFLMQAGTTYVYRCGGLAAPNGLAFPWFGWRGQLTVPGLGIVHLDPQSAILLPLLVLNGPMAESSFQVPAHPSFVGLQFSMQAALLGNGVLHLTPGKHEVVRS